MQSQCVRIPLKQGKTQRFLDWIQSVQHREPEMLESMRAEGVTFECMFLERTETAGDSLVFYMRATDLAEAQRRFALSTLAIDVETRALIAECWDTERAALLTPCLELGSTP
jgi:hypothetical protein